MSSVLHSPLTTVRLFLEAETRPSSCGTPLLSASTPSRYYTEIEITRQFTNHLCLYRRKVTPTGYPVSGSLPTTTTQLLYHVAGIVWSRSGIWPIAV